MPPVHLPSSFANLPGVVRGALWTVLGAACLVGFSTIAKHLAAELPLMVMVFFRGLFGIVFLAPWLVRNGIGALRTRRPMLLASRGLNTLFGLYCMFAAVAMMSIADVVAILYSKPMFASLAAVLILGEVMYARRWIALGVGTIGMLLIIRPGFAELNYGALFALGAMASGAYTTITVKFLTRTEKPDAIVVWALLVMLPASLIPALITWQTPTVEQFLWLAALGGLATCFQRCLTRGYAAADATVVMPFEFSRLIFAALLGFAVFGDLPDIWTWVGGTIIFTAGFYMVRREAGHEKAAAAGADPA